MLGRKIITGTRPQVYRFLRPRIVEPQALAELFQRVA